MKEIENISLEKYLKMIGFDEEEISMILDYANSEIDKKVLHEKVKYLISYILRSWNGADNFSLSIDFFSMLYNQWMNSIPSDRRLQYFDFLHNLLSGL